ncbi:Protein LST [Ananas comosus]|uniref:Target of rapamycin complex subunit LST8 n=1 Tax=Ananas comosus TaxID=4615 RepID=A0A199UQ49_ANACO|nr:Protein LST [Ananas comosus]
MAGEEAVAVAVAVAVATGGYDPGIKTRDSCASLCRPDHVNRLEITPDRRLLAAAGNPSIQFYEINPEVNYPVLSYDSHIRNVTAIGFERDGNWMYSGSEDGMVKIWDLMAKTQKEYQSCSAVNTVVLHPSQVPEADTAMRSSTVT